MGGRMKRWKIGVIGAGYWSETHLEAWRGSERAQVVAICDLNLEQARERGRQYGIPEERCFDSVEAMLRSGDDIDAVDIVTRPDSHRDLVGRVCAAGKHILCQKPFAPDFASADAMAAAAREANVRLMVTENWRWMEPIQAVRGVLDAGTLGRLQAVRYRHKRYSTPLMAPGQPLGQPYFRSMPHLLFYEMGVHWYDTWRFLFGLPERLYAEFGKASPHVVGEDIGVVVLAHQGFLGHLDASWASREEISGPADLEAGLIEEMVIEGERATLRLTPTGKARAGRLELIDSEGVVTVLREGLRFDIVESFRRLQGHFIDCLDSGSPFQTSAEDNRETLRLTFATYDSAREHRAITLG
jgi:predicted dehydrogenase